MMVTIEPYTMASHMFLWRTELPMKPRLCATPSFITELPLRLTNHVCEPSCFSTTYDVKTDNATATFTKEVNSSILWRSLHVLTPWMYSKRLFQKQVSFSPWVPTTTERMLLNVCGCSEPSLRTPRWCTIAPCRIPAMKIQGQRPIALYTECTY